MKNCYLCDSTDNLTKDHIPPKNLFPSPKPTNLITVWCCKKCNEKFSLIDESFRVFTSSVINRSKSGTRIWDEKVMQSSFKRSPKLKTATIKSLVPIETEINGIKVQVTGMTYPIKKTKNYLVRLTKGFTRHFNPEIDLSRARFKVNNIIPNQQLVDMLHQKFFYVEKGDGVFKMWRMFVKNHIPESVWVYVFYDGLMFMITVKQPLNIPKLFDEKLGLASDSIELAKLKNKFKDYDPTYVAVSTMVARSEFRKRLESVWKQYKSYADSNFLSEFKKQFNQRVWELHFGATLLNRGYILGKHKDAGPDFKISHNDKNIWIEAIAVEKGDGKDKVPNIEYGKVMDVPEKEMLLRLTAGLREKHQKYLTYLENGLVSQDDPFVIAIDRSPLEHPDAQIPLILKCLFAIGHQVLFIKREKPQPKTEGSTWSAREKVNKISGGGVEMLMFRDTSFEGISAVVYCTQNILNSPKNPNQMGDNFVIVHNPFAKNLLPDKFFKFGEVWKQEGDRVEKI